jgi:hypothetical protein
VYIWLRQVQKVPEGGHPGHAVVVGGVLGCGVRDPGRVAHEQHRGRHVSGKDSRVMPGRRGQQRDLTGGEMPAQHPGAALDEGGVEGDGQADRLLRHGHRGAVADRSFLDPRAYRGHQPVQRLGVGGPGVQPAAERRRHRVGGVGPHRHPADGGVPAAQPGLLVRRQDGVPEGEHRVVPVGHPGGPGVVALAGQVQPPPPVRPDPGADPDRSVHIGQCPALLHVQLHERTEAGEQLRPRPDTGWIGAVAGHRGGERDPVPVG